MDGKIYTALNVPASAPQPSISCVQWSGDGQLIVTTRNVIYILTPDLGINFDTLSLLKTAVDRRKARDSKEATVSLGWHRNLIEFDRSMQHHWQAETQGWGALALGSLNFSWRAVVSSPSNLTSTSGCLLVALNSNLELSLWRAAKNHLKEAWLKIQDITAVLKEIPMPNDSKNTSQESRTYLRTLQAQTNCMAWSEQTDFGLKPNRLVDTSLLALGTRAGSVILMRHDGKDSVFSIKITHVANEWITHLAWSPWRSIQPSQSEALLACGISDGSIVLMRVHQKLEQQPSLTPFGCNITIHCEAELLDIKASIADGKGITALAWVTTSLKLPTLVHAKPGILRFFSILSVDPIRGSETPALRLNTQKLSVGSSSLTPVVGVSSIRGLDALIITLFDGSFHVVHNVSTLPTLDDKNSMDVDDAGGSVLSSSNLSRRARVAFVAAEAGTMKALDVCFTSGATNFDGSGTMIWLHEACRPTDFSYKPEASHNSMLVVAQIWEDPKRNESVVRLLREIFEHPELALGHAPIHTLRPAFLQLGYRAVFDAIWLDVIQCLSLSLPNENEAPIQPWTNAVDDMFRKEFRKSLTIALYGWEDLHSTRLRLAVADACWKMSTTDEMRAEFGRVAQSLLNIISHRFLGIVVKHLSAVIGVVTEKDIPFIMRVVVQSLLEGSPTSLSEKANELNDAAKSSFPSSEAFNLSEPCPACDAPIPLENLLSAVCPQGHVWTRCSLTSFVLSTPMVRTCIGCTRKAFLPPSARDSDKADSLMWIPEAGRSWIVDELLESARCCLYCGNNFVRIL